MSRFWGRCMIRRPVLFGFESPPANDQIGQGRAHRGRSPLPSSKRNSRASVCTVTINPIWRMAVLVAEQIGQSLAILGQDYCAAGPGTQEKCRRCLRRRLVMTDKKQGWPFGTLEGRLLCGEQKDFLCGMRRRGCCCASTDAEQQIARPATSGKQGLTGRPGAA